MGIDNVIQRKKILPHVCHQFLDFLVQRMRAIPLQRFLTVHDDTKNPVKSLCSFLREALVKGNVLHSWNGSAGKECPSECVDLLGRDTRFELPRHNVFHDHDGRTAVFFGPARRLLCLTLTAVRA